MRSESLPAIGIAVAQERRLDLVLDRIVGMLLGGEDGVALARVWLIDDGDVCASCRMRAECPDQSRCLHLVASAGNPTNPGEPWSRLDGDFRRFPLGTHKVGKVGATGSGILLRDMSERSTWIVRPEWARREGIRSFAAQPLVCRGEVLGVLAIFSRTPIDARTFAALRTVADHTAVAIANARALETSERRRTQLEAENACLRADLKGTRAGGGIVGASPALRKVLEQVDLVAPTDASVLVLGESGSGKDLVAHRVHERSRRADGPFIKVSCAIVARELLESELFGHETGARGGRVQAADGGTLFLDEIDALPLALQERLLRVLQEAVIERAGASRPRPVNVRIVAATGRDLAQEVAASRFREDLYLRLSVFPIAVPALRDRPADVAHLAEYFLRQACARLGRPVLRLSSRDLRTLERYPWPGNVRELAGIVERAALLGSDGRVRLGLDAGTHPTRSSSVGPGEDVIPAAEWRRRERDNLATALRKAGGRIYGPGGAAELLGVPPTTLASRIKVLGVGKPADG